jgi:tetratricopeptide (TPR) repeat protein
MDTNILGQLGKIAGIAGIALGIFFLLFRGMLKKIQVPGLKQEHWYRVIIIFMILVWTIAILGVGAWIFDPNRHKKTEIEVSQSENEYKLLLEKAQLLITWTADTEASTLVSNSSQKDSRARVFCEQLIKLKPDDSYANGLYARSLIMEGRVEEAIAKYEKAANLGDAHSSLVLGLYFLLWIEPNRDTGISYLNKAAQLGNEEAMIELGKTYELGRLSLPDYKQAATFYEMAVEKKSSEGYYRLGQLYQFGLGVVLDIDKAKILYRKAIELDNQEAIPALNDMQNRK